MTELPPGLYAYHDLQPGDHLWTGWAEVTPTLIDAFANLTGDRYGIHLSDEAARAEGFPARVAHGLLILSLVEGLKSTAPARLDTFASLGWDWSFRAPVFVHDHIRARVEVKAKRAAGVGKGLLTLAIEVETQARIVQRGEARLIARRYLTK